MNLAPAKQYAPAILRIGMSLVFLWFGIDQLIHTERWVGVVPDYAIQLSGLSAATLVIFNGTFEIIFGTLLLAGIYTRTVSLLLALHMIHILTTVGYSPIGVRDFGLTIASISIFLNGMSPWSIDWKWRRRASLTESSV